MGTACMGEAHAEIFLLAAGVLLLASLLLSRIGGRLGIPGLLLFLGVGMLAGSDGLGIQFHDYRTAQIFGVVALAFILFQGGLDTNWALTKPVVRRGLSLYAGRADHGGPDGGVLALRVRLSVAGGVVAGRGGQQHRCQRRFQCPQGTGAGAEG